MDVTKQNFAAVVDEFCSLVQTCDFFAFDEEMTGINLSGCVETPLMSPSERYAAKRQVAERYNIIQVGVCLFHKQNKGNDNNDTSVGDGTSGQYIARPFTFFLFPASMENLKESTTADVVMSASAIDFLRKHGMNFQQWVYDGVPYCNEPQEIIIRKQFLEAGDLVASGGRGSDSSDANALTSMLSTEEQTWLQNCLATAQTFSQSDPKSSSELMVPSTKRRGARDMLRSKVEAQFNNLLVAFRGRAAQKDCVLVRVTPEEKQRKLDSDKQFRERALLDTIGFRKVFHALTACKKPCVGHNAFADVLFLLAALDRPLPPTLDECKRRIRDLFPLVYDTKVISQSLKYFPKERFESTHLGGLHDALTQNAKWRIQLPLGFHAYDEKTLMKSSKSGKASSAHEAGYDAMMTGFVLINLLAEAGLTLHTAAQEFGNRIALFRSVFLVDVNVSASEHPLVKEYIALGPVITFEHNRSVSATDIENCLVSTGGAADLDLTVMSSTTTSSVAVPFNVTLQEHQATRIVTAINEKHAPSIRAAVWTPKEPVVCKATGDITAAHDSAAAKQTSVFGSILRSPRMALKRLLENAARRL